MGDHLPDTRAADLEAAASQVAAASALLDDRRCDPADAVFPLVRGWRHLARALAGGEALPAAAVLAERFAAAPVPGLRPVDRALLEGGLPPLLAAHRAREAGGAHALSRRVLRVQRRLLHRAVIAARGELFPGRSRPGVLYATAGVSLLAAALLGVFFGGSAAHGWRGAYFANTDLAGEPVLRLDPELVFDWTWGAPMRGFPADDFSVRWDTCLRLDRPESVKFSLGSDDGARLIVDGETLVDVWKIQDLHWNYRTIPLEAGIHHVRVEYFEKTERAEVALWLTGGGEAGRVFEGEAFLLPPAAANGENPCEALR